MWRSAVGSLALIVMSHCACVTAGTFIDPLDEPASMSYLASTSMISAVAVAGNSLVAVGARGHVLVSDDDGASWIQSPVPLSTDLVAVHFPTPLQGWAVGHDSVIIHTSDGGKTWTRQLDGRMALKRLQARYEYSMEKSDAIAAILRSIKITMAQSSDPDCLPLPLLDIWFKDEKVGYAVGAFNLIFHTSDGGEHWEPWLDKVDNPSEYNLNAIRGQGDAAYIVGERGLVLKLDQASGRFTPLALSYDGSFFGLIVEPDYLVVFGMRGHAFISNKDGADFRQLTLGTTQTLVGGGALDDGRIALATQGGQLFVSDPSISRLSGIASPRMSGVLGATAIGADAMALATSAGVTRAQINRADLSAIDAMHSETVPRP